MGEFDGDRLTVRQVDRFSNVPVGANGVLYWDVLSLWQGISEGLSKAAISSHGAVASVGIDTWGIDFVLLDRLGNLLGNAVHYRDSRTAGMLSEAFARVPRQEIYAATGVQFIEINSLYHLLSMALRKDPQLEAASCLLTMPDLFNYWLTGERAVEFTNATTTQCFDIGRNEWASAILTRLNIPTHIFPTVVPDGTPLGNLLPAVAETTGLNRTQVIAPATHDTASAVAAIPFLQGMRSAFVSSGTWSLVGMEISGPVINDTSLDLNFTNEGGAAGTVLFLRNIVGLWLLQECRRVWASQVGSMDYDDLVGDAMRGRQFASLIDPNAAEFLRPGDMPRRIADFCQLTHQAVPDDVPSVVRTVLESLALKYRVVLDQLRVCSGRSPEVIHIVGGGSKNRLLCQWTADSTQLPVAAGPVEAAAIGNLAIQAVALREISSLHEARQVVRASFPIELFEPNAKAKGAWDEAYARFLSITKDPIQSPRLPSPSGFNEN